MAEQSEILLVDDSKMDVALTLDAFRERHLENNIRVLYDGDQAIDYLLGNGKYSDRKKYPLPGIILLDLKMPRVDGFEVLKVVKQTPLIRRIPIIVLTSSKDEGDRIMSYDSGANSYLVKPVTFEGFIEVIDRVTEYWLTLNISAPNDE